MKFYIKGSIKLDQLHHQNIPLPLEDTLATYAPYSLNCNLYDNIKITTPKLHFSEQHII